MASSPSNKTDRAYELLEEMITFKELEPGQPLSESLLMELTGFGRTPVREAMQRLARERMIDIIPRRGAFVTPISVEGHFRLLELRRTLETLAVELATYRGRTRQKEEMLQLAALMEAGEEDPRKFGELLKRAHSLVATAGHNDYLQLALAPLQALSRRFWFSHLPDVAEHLRIAGKRHASILQAVAHGDSDEAVAASQRLNDYLVDLTYQALNSPPKVQL